jgi:membrane protein
VTAVDGRVRNALKRVIEAVRRYTERVWGRDRAAQRGWSAAWTQLARIVTFSVRGVFMHRLSHQAAALAYYTLFSIVPVLVVALWAVKLLHLIPYLTPAEAEVVARAGGPSEVRLPDANQFLREAARGILAAVDRAERKEPGLIGLAALLYAVIRQVRHVEVALDTIAGARDRRPAYKRMLGFFALLALPPALLIVSGAVRLLAKLPLGARFAEAISWLLAHVPLLKSAMGASIGLTILCLALAVFYASAARARIALSSAVVGGALSAVALAVVLWVFARLQIGASRVGTLESGMAAVPVFVLWAFTSWMVVLIGAEVAVAHQLDGILIHGTRALRLEPYEERVAGVQLMVEATRRARLPGDRGATARELARRMRLLPANVRELAGRLERGGLLRQDDDGRYRLACDPERTSLRDVVGALICRPPDRRAATAGRAGATLRELADRAAGARARAAALSSNDVVLSSE